MFGALDIDLICIPSIHVYYIFQIRLSKSKVCLYFVLVGLYQFKGRRQHNRHEPNNFQLNCSIAIQLMRKRNFLLSVCLSMYQSVHPFICLLDAVCRVCVCVVL